VRRSRAFRRIVFGRLRSVAVRLELSRKPERLASPGEGSCSSKDLCLMDGRVLETRLATEGCERPVQRPVRTGRNASPGHSTDCKADQGRGRACSPGIGFRKKGEERRQRVRWPDEGWPVLCGVGRRTDGGVCMRTRHETGHECISHEPAGRWIDDGEHRSLMSVHALAEWSVARLPLGSTLCGSLRACKGASIGLFAFKGWLGAMDGIGRFAARPRLAAGRPIPFRHDVSRS